MGEVTKLFWTDIESCCIELCNKIQELSYNVEAIISVQRGGCIPGVIISHILSVDEFYTIGIRTTSSESIRAIRYEHPILLVPDTLENITGKNVLIVDDVTNTGNTLKYAKREIMKYAPNKCLTSVLIWDGDNSSKCMADLFARYSPYWVVFPWEGKQN